MTIQRVLRLTRGHQVRHAVGRTRAAPMAGTVDGLAPADGQHGSKWPPTARRPAVPRALRRRPAGGMRAGSGRTGRGRRRMGGSRTDPRRRPTGGGRPDPGRRRSGRRRTGTGHGRSGGNRAQPVRQRAGHRQRERCGRSRARRRQPPVSRSWGSHRLSRRTDFFYIPFAALNLHRHAVDHREFCDIRLVLAGQLPYDRHGNLSCRAA